MPEEQPIPIKVTEHVLLEKFDGDPPAEGEKKEPIETIQILDGEVIQHTKRGEVVFDKEAGVDPRDDTSQPYSIPED